MKGKTTHEPSAKVMGAGEVLKDSRQIAAVLRENLRRSERKIRLSIPLSLFLSALDQFTKPELETLRQRLEKCLAK